MRTAAEARNDVGGQNGGRRERGWLAFAVAPARKENVSVPPSQAFWKLRLTKWLFSGVTSLNCSASSCE